MEDESLSIEERLHGYMRTYGESEPFSQILKDVEQLEVDAKLGALVRRLPELLEFYNYAEELHLVYRKDKSYDVLAAPDEDDMTSATSLSSAYVLASAEEALSAACHAMEDDLEEAASFFGD